MCAWDRLLLGGDIPSHDRHHICSNQRDSARLSLPRRLGSEGGLAMGDVDTLCGGAYAKDLSGMNVSPFFAADSPRIELYLMDCVHGMAMLEESSVSVVVTSPPYNIGIDYRTYEDRRTP